MADENKDGPGAADGGKAEKKVDSKPPKKNAAAPGAAGTDTAKGSQELDQERSARQAAEKALADAKSAIDVTNKLRELFSPADKKDATPDEALANVQRELAELKDHAAVADLSRRFSLSDDDAELIGNIKDPVARESLAKRLQSPPGEGDGQKPQGLAPIPGQGHQPDMSKQSIEQLYERFYPSKKGK